MVSSATAVWRKWWKNLDRNRSWRRRPGTPRSHAARALASRGAALVLEERVLLSTITVTSAADPSGTHTGVTLRDAISQANLSSGPDTIVFDSSLNGTSIKLSQGELAITDSLTIRGNGAGTTVIDAQARSRVFNIGDGNNGNVNVSLDGLTVTGGKTVTNLQSGGAILLMTSGSLTVSNSAITGNSTTGTGSSGGALYVATGSVTLTNSTVSANKTSGSVAGGGGIYLVNGSLTLKNSTLTGNSTIGEQAFGGGICSMFADITVENSTVAKNSTTGSYSSGGGIYERSGHVTLTNSILAQNTIKTGGYPDIFLNYTFGGSITADHTLIGNRQGLTLLPAPVGSPDANGNLIGANGSPIDPKLGALADNGGPTQTMALLTGSPAINAGGSTTLQFDQRGYTRVAGGTVDMGAFEYGSSVPGGPTLPTVTLSIDSTSLAEAGGQGSITATLSTVSTLDTTITLAFSGTATNVSDYTRSAAQIVIPAGQLSGSITLTAVQDALYEGNETVVVDVGTITNGTPGGAQEVIATIVDGQTAPTVSLNLSSANLAEAAGQATVTATLSSVSALDTTITLGFTGTATNVSDYTRSATQIVIPAGQLTGSITLTAVQDSVYEGNETVVVSISTVTNGTENGVQKVTATIVDDDPPPLPSVNLSLGSATLAEAAGQSTVTATLSAASTLDTTITLGFAGTAANVSDYTRSATQIVIPAGQLTGSITLTAVQDTLYEGNETVIVSIASVTNGTTGGTQQVTATIVDDDSAPTVNLTQSSSTIAEAGGQNTVTATLSAVSSLDTTVTLSFGGTATNVSDYTRSGTQIVIPAGQLSGSISLTAVQDTLYEKNETVVINITTVTNGTENGIQKVTTTIVDDDPAPSVTLSLDTPNMAEAGGQATVTATLSAASALNTTVTLSFGGTATSGTDYTTSATTIVIPAGQLSASTTLTAVQDSLVEGNESILVDIVGVTNGTENGVQRVTATIVDDDTPALPAVSLSLDTANLAEAAGQSVVTATLSSVSTLDTTITLGFSGTATNASDYSRSATQIVIPAGQLTGSIVLTAVQDSLVEGNETIIVSISAVANGTAGSTPQVTATIVDDDGPSLPGVRLSIGSTNLAEAAGQSTVTATLSTVSTLDTTVTLGFAGSATSGSDYTRSATQIVIPAGQLSGSITLTAVQDTLYEGNETVVVSIANITNGTPSGTQQVTATIVDDDSAPTVSLSLNSANMAEAAGQSTVTATLSAVSAFDTTVNLGFAGSATSGSDYTRSASQIVIPAGQLTGSITLTAVQNSVYEGNETVVVSISTVTNGTENGIQKVTATIVDDETPPNVSLSLSAANLAEAAGESTVTATLSAVSGLDTTISLGFSGTATSGSDYTASAATIVIPAGQLTGSITLTAVQDTSVEGNETVIVSLTTISNAVAGGVQQVTATIVDDDSPSPSSTNVLFSGQYYNPANNLLTSVSQDGQSLTFTNAAGVSVTGTLTGTYTANISLWGQTATFTNGAFVFSGGGTWKKLDLSSDYTNTAGDSVHVYTDGTTLTFVNKAGGTSPGFWTSPTQVTAVAWGVTGVVSNGQIVWANNTAWNKNLFAAATGAGGAGQVSITDAGTQITLTNKSGGTSRAQITDAGTIVALDWGVTGTRNNGKITWSNGTSWDNFDLTSLDAVFSDIRSYPFGG